ncbi:MAG: CHAT domain-containing protein [Bacteroidota bacterium]
MANRPVIFLAFANVPVQPMAREDDELPDSMRHLDALKREMDQLSGVLTEQRILLQRRDSTTIKVIEQVFLAFPRGISVFHFGGHATEKGLVFEDDEEQNVLAYQEGLVNLLALQPGLKLVFFNGCVTSSFLNRFQQTDIPAFIYTRTPVVDTVATIFATLFYTNLQQEKPLKEAFDLAVAGLKTRFGKPEKVYRGLTYRRKPVSPPPDLVPYELYLKPGDNIGEQTISEWASEEEPERKVPLQPEVYLQCNRYPQGDQFYEEWGSGLQKKAVYVKKLFIGGQYDELPDHMASRLRLYGIARAWRSWKSEEVSQSDVAQYRLELPVKRDFQSRDPEKPRKRYLSSVTDTLKLPALKAELLKKQFSNGKKVFFIEHDLQPDQWHRGIEEFLEWCFWEAWPREITPNGPQVLLIVNSFYPKRALITPRTWRLARQMENSAKNLCDRHPDAIFLEPLSPISKEDVMRWYRTYMQPYTDEVGRIFGSKSQLPLQELKPYLEQAIERYNR